MSVISRHFNGVVISSSQPVSATLPLPDTSMFMLPGQYLYGGIGWDCTAPGLYRFKGSDLAITNRIVYGGDLYALLAAISWNHVHGLEHEEYCINGDWQGLSNLGMFQKWRLRCGYIADFCLWLMPQLDVQARRLQVMTAEPFNGFDDGHVLFETFTNGAWRMWDITNGVYFTDSSGNHLDFDGFREVIDSGSYPSMIRMDSSYKRNAELINGTFDISVYADMSFRTPQDCEAWYRRVFQKKG